MMTFEDVIFCLVELSIGFVFAASKESLLPLHQDSSCMRSLLIPLLKIFMFNA